ncbi:MAG: hypothetical protein LBP70_02595 [Mycoplasmataceae bacterium]|nr:hypothetical protein [Mycoplasmataceae bacterium]
MDQKQKNNFKFVKSKIERICEDYRIAQIKLKFLESKPNKQIADQNKIYKYRNYINTFELILQCLNKEDADLIRNVSLLRIPIQELGYSNSIYYDRYRKAASTFLRYIS